MKFLTAIPLLAAAGLAIAVPTEITSSPSSTGFLTITTTVDFRVNKLTPRVDSMDCSARLTAREPEPTKRDEEKMQPHSAPAWARKCTEWWKKDILMRCKGDKGELERYFTEACPEGIEDIWESIPNNEPPPWLRPMPRQFDERLDSICSNYPWPWALWGPYE